MWLIVTITTIINLFACGNEMIEVCQPTLHYIFIPIYTCCKYAKTYLAYKDLSMSYNILYHTLLLYYDLPLTAAGSNPATVGTLNSFM